MEIEDIPSEGDGGLYPHQLLVKRAAVYHRTMLLLHHAGQGKTRAMVAAATHFEGSLLYDKAVVITKANIAVFTKTDVQAQTGANPADFFKFITFQVFARDYGGFDEVQLKRAFARKILVIDEAHTVSSFAREGGGAGRSLYSTLVMLRNLLPDMLVIAMTATPMINSPSELVHLTNVLVPAECPWTGAEVIPPDLRAPGPVVGPDDEEDEGDADRCCDILIGRVLIFYQGPPGAAKQAKFGKRIDLGALSGALSGGPDTVAFDPPDPHLFRKVLVMSQVQSRAYAASFLRSDFYRVARENSVCVPADPGSPGGPGVLERGVLLAYWLGIERAALDAGEWGVSAWFFDDIVAKGAEVFKGVLEEHGWAKWDHSLTPTPGGPPRYVLLTGDRPISRNLQKALGSPENVRGEIIRTIIYTRAIREGTSFEGVLRGGSVVGWSEAWQLQADSRRLRTNSFDRLSGYLGDPEFRGANAKFIKNGAVVPIAYDALVVPDPRVLEEAATDDLRNMGLAGSMDARMLQLRNHKTERIARVFTRLTRASLDAAQKRQRADPPLGSHHARFALSDAYRALAEGDRDAPFPIDAAASGNLPFGPLWNMRAGLLRPSPAKDLAGPPGGRDVLWGTGSMGLGFAPRDHEETLATRDLLDPMAYYLPRDAYDRTQRRLRLQCAAKIVGESPHLWADPPALVKMIGEGDAVLLAMFARFWVVGRYNNHVAIGTKFPGADTEFEAEEDAILFNWDRVETVLYAPDTSVPEGGAVQAMAWTPAEGDTLSMRHALAEIAEGGDGPVLLLTHLGNTKVMNGPGVVPDPRGTGRSGRKARVVFGLVCAPKNSRSNKVPALFCLNYRYKGRGKSVDQSVRVYKEEFDAGRHIRYVLLPEKPDGTAPAVVLPEEDRPSPDTGGPRDYVGWATRIIARRLGAPWTCIPIS